MVSKISGAAERQLTPEEEQLVGTEIQELRVPGILPRIEEPDPRTAPLPSLPRAPLPSPEVRQEQLDRQALFGIPALRTDRYSGASQEFVMLVRWDIPDAFTGDLENIAVLSNNDAKTRLRIVINGVDQNLPTDKQITTPNDWSWNKTTALPGGSSVTVEVRSTDGTTIAVDATITGTER